MTVTVNLVEQYGKVVEYLDDYRKFAAEVNTHVVLVKLRDLRNWPPMMRESIKSLLQMNLLSGKNPEIDRKSIPECATEEQKKNDYYPILISEYPLHELSVALEHEFPDCDFEKIEKLHELMKVELSRFNITHWVGVVLAAAAFLLKSIPESIVKRVVNYETFELVVFLFAAFAALYLFVILLPFWLLYYKARRSHDFAGTTIEYTAIRVSKKSDSSDRLPGDPPASDLGL